MEYLCLERANRTGYSTPLLRERDVLHMTVRGGFSFPKGGITCSGISPSQVVSLIGEYSEESDRRMRTIENAIRTIV